MEAGKINPDEQWKQGGDCKKCRRQPYCSKECGAVKRKNRLEMALLREQIMDAILPPNFPRDTRW